MQKLILLSGVCDSGKTTILNSVINYLDLKTEKYRDFVCNDSKKRDKSAPVDKTKVFKYGNWNIAVLTMGDAISEKSESGNFPNIKYEYVKKFLDIQPCKNTLFICASRTRGGVFNFYKKIFKDDLILLKSIKLFKEDVAGYDFVHQLQIDLIISLISEIVHLR